MLNQNSRCFLLTFGLTLLALFKNVNANLKWVKNEFKVVVDGYECFYQTVDDGAVLVTSFQVIRGDDITCTLTHPNGTIIKYFERLPHGSDQVQKATQGDYALCFDNTYSHITSKLVSVYILTFHEEVLMKKFQEDHLVNETVVYARKSVDNITLNLVEVYTHQAMSRFKQARHEYLLESNNDLVLYWSAFQSLLIILCGMFQVYFIKRLFTVSSSSKSSSNRYGS